MMADSASAMAARWASTLIRAASAAGMGAGTGVPEIPDWRNLSAAAAVRGCPVLRESWTIVHGCGRGMKRDPSFLATRVSAVTVPTGNHAFCEALVRIGWALYSISISLSAGCSGERSVAGSGGLSALSRSFAIR